MKTIINQLLISVIAVLFIFPFAYAATTNVTQGKLILKGKLPKGVAIKNNVLTLKDGYTFEKVSKSRINVLARRQGTGITGSFDCTCNGNSGGCDVTITPTSASCSKSTCTSSCYMIVTIPGSTVKGFIYRK